MYGCIYIYIYMYISVFPIGYIQRYTLQRPTTMWLCELGVLTVLRHWLNLSLLARPARNPSARAPHAPADPHAPARPACRLRLGEPALDVHAP